MDQDSANRFAALYKRNHADVVRFIARRTGDERAEDVAHDAFLVAWRRLADVPTAPNDARAFLFGVARGCLLNDARGARRGQALVVRIADDAREAVVPGVDGAAATRVDLMTAWATLTPAQQEMLALVTWDDLTTSEAGRVLGISGPTFRVRLSRARGALRRALQEQPEPANQRELTTHLKEALS